MNVWIENRTKGAVRYGELMKVVKALNVQVDRDFRKHWDTSAKIRYRREQNIDLQPERDAVIYLQKEADSQEDVFGYHSLHDRGIPFGVVFTDVSTALGEPWSTTLSHEVLELIMDPEINLFAVGPHPVHHKRTVMHWYEMCDAVQTEVYEIQGVLVSNFVLPLYFTPGEESFSKSNNFLGSPLSSFSVRPGGYIGYYDPLVGEHETYAQRGDRRARERLSKKNRVAAARRGGRYQTLFSKGGGR
jgi:hypothetical protein